MNTNHPWQSGPSELIRHAIEHLHQEDDFNQRIAFLLLDVGIETLFKTFLQLPEEVTGTKVSFSERTQASEGKFHELVRGVKKAAGNRLDNVDLTHIQFYHDLRNKLYHEGNGISVPTDKVKGYASLAVECLKILLGIDLYPFLFSKQEEEQRKAEEQAKFEEFEQARQELKAQLKDLHQMAALALEGIEAALVLPSFRKQYEKWDELFTAQFHAWNSKLRLEQKIAETDFEGKHQPEQYASFLAELQPTMPHAFRDLVNKYHLKGDDVIYLATRNDFEEVVLNIVIIVLNLSIDLDYTYFKTELILCQKPIDLDEVMPILGQDVKDPASELIKLSKEVSKEIKVIRDTLFSRTQGS